MSGSLVDEDMHRIAKRVFDNIRVAGLQQFQLESFSNKSTLTSSRRTPQGEQPRTIGHARFRHKPTSANIDNHSTTLQIGKTDKYRLPNDRSLCVEVPNAPTLNFQLNKNAAQNEASKALKEASKGKRHCIEKENSINTWGPSRDCQPPSSIGLFNDPKLSLVPQPKPENSKSSLSYSTTVPYYSHIQHVTESLRRYNASRFSVFPSHQAANFSRWANSNNSFYDLNNGSTSNQEQVLNQAIQCTQASNFGYPDLQVQLGPMNHMGLFPQLEPKLPSTLELMPSASIQMEEKEEEGSPLLLSDDD